MHKGVTAVGASIFVLSAVSTVAVSPAGIALGALLMVYGAITDDTTNGQTK